MNTNAHHLLGAYILGGLDPADVTLFEAHLQDCGACRKELAELEKVPMLLDSLPVPDAVALTAVPGGSDAPDTSVPGRLFDELVRRRRTLRRRWAALAGALAAACLAVGLAAGPLLARPPQPDATYSVASGGGLQVNIDMARKTWGTELAVSGSSLPAEGTLSLWVRDRAGGEDRACAWTATPSGKVKVTGATPLQLGSISSVELRDGAQRSVAVITVP
ncbi:anti-sigma factor family protein [Arthrobacter sp. SLBN-122]|uniref:anti-sigma factor family protein n=1 Tax=Arthrobacter sp. SLBN-122 TaxID=2768455 RepID=UPI0011525381|nr:zf-HC2 domain-containing protein [Arthrobacter sp. SLBN-122]TQJ34145.1 putative zinc finger protein [Arthrobacter sp. SLBN-122]